MRIARWLMASCLLLAAAQAAAVDLLFRGDERGPEIIFNEGFQPAGTNRNVLAHISGRSCWIGDGAMRSAYVATTTLMEDARRYGQNVYAQSSYVYRIVPNADAADDTASFDVRTALHDMANRPELGLDFQVQTTIWRLANFHATPGQYISERVPAAWIHSVDIYERNQMTGEMVFRRNELNPRFVRPARVGGRIEFTQTMIAALEPVDTIVFAGAGNNATAACLGGCTAPSARAVPPLVPPTAWEQCGTEDVFIPGNPFQQLMDIILDEEA